MTLYARICAATLARAHARSGDRIAIASYLGNSDVFDQAIADFSSAYADQNERDYQALAQAVQSGRVVHRPACNERANKWSGECLSISQTFPPPPSIPRDDRRDDREIGETTAGTAARSRPAHARRWIVVESQQQVQRGNRACSDHLVRAVLVVAQDVSRSTMLPIP